jgi:hypothetical protein
MHEWKLGDPLVHETYVGGGPPFQGPCPHADRQDFRRLHLAELGGGPRLRMQRRSAESGSPANETCSSRRYGRRRTDDRLFTEPAIAEINRIARNGRQEPFDRVLYHPDDQFEVELQGATYLVMRERDLHAIANERPEHGTGLYL